MAETPEAPETTPHTEWVVPNQDKFEQVIDARLAKHAEAEKTKKSTSRTSAAKTEDDKSADAKQDAPKS